MPEDADLNLAEVLYDSGGVRFRYTRYMAPDGSRWIRHGLFVAYYEDGSKSSEGRYHDGKEHGVWRDFHANGQLASEGSYQEGHEVGAWQFWNSDGREETPTKNDH